jgi:hypothetical protein
MALLNIVFPSCFRAWTRRVSIKLVKLHSNGTEHHPLQCPERGEGLFSHATDGTGAPRPGSPSSNIVAGSLRGSPSNKILRDIRAKDAELESARRRETWIQATLLKVRSQGPKASFGVTKTFLMHCEILPRSRARPWTGINCGT